MILEAFPGRGRTGSNMNPARRERNPTGERGAWRPGGVANLRTGSTGSCGRTLRT